MKQKFYICRHCGNIISMIRDKGVPVYCCGEKMQEIGQEKGCGSAVSRVCGFEKRLGAGTICIAEET